MDACRDHCRRQKPEWYGPPGAKDPGDDDSGTARGGRRSEHLDQARRQAPYVPHRRPGERRDASADQHDLWPALFGILPGLLTEADLELDVRPELDASS